MSMRSDLGKVRGLGAAHNGTEHFLMQRVTAIANVPLVIFILYFVISHLGAPRAAVLESLKNPLAAIALSLSIISITWHMKLGLQMVIEDYIHGHGTKMAALLANLFYASALAAIGLYAILKMSFGV